MKMHIGYYKYNFFNFFTILEFITNISSINNEIVTKTIYISGSVALTLTISSTKCSML